MKVNFFATLRQVAGCKSCDMPATEDVLSLLKELAKQWPELHGFVINDDETDSGDYVTIIVNGRYIEGLNGVATKLAEQDEISIIPVVAGG